MHTKAIGLVAGRMNECIRGLDQLRNIRPKPRKWSLSVNPAAAARASHAGNSAPRPTTTRTASQDASL